MTIEKFHHCTIKGYSKKGHGIANCDTLKKDLHVLASVEGDELEIEIIKKKRKEYVGKIAKVIKPSSDRIEPPCPLIGNCGGCSYQQIDYNQQLSIKQNQISQFYPGHEIQPIIESSPFHYRNKMEFSFTQDKQGNKYLGLIRSFSNGKAVNIDTCYLCPLWFSKVLNNVKKWWDSTNLQAYNFNNDTGSLLYLTIRDGLQTGEKMILLTVSGSAQFALSHNLIAHFKEACLSNFDESDHAKISIYLMVRQIKKNTPTQLFEMHLHGPTEIHEKLFINGKSYTFEMSPQAFFQPNTKQAEKIYEQAIKFTSLNKNTVLFDLYCGTGSIGICMADQVKQVIGIEVNRYSTLNAESNLKINQIDNYTLLEGDVEKLFLQASQISDEKVIILDPPRSGVGEKMAKMLLDVDAKQLIYISCNPKTQYHDLQTLQSGYTIKAIQPVDQFPHTPHFENIVVLEKI